MAAAFTEEEKAVDDALGYPKAYAKLCRGGGGAVGLPYSHGPPHAFLPYILQPHEALRAKDLNEMFPVTDAEAPPTANPRGFANLLWKQLDHLGNAGFDPALFRVDAYGNVLYLHADSASPLAWDIDHWFPCARGGKTVPSNLRIVQWQVCRKKQNKLEFLMPWWDLQLGVSVNQFLSIFASKNSDFRNRAFAFLFTHGASEELNSLQVVEAHAFPQHFSEMKTKVGLAPAAIVSSRGSDNSVLKSLDANRPLRPSYPLIAAKKFTGDRDENVNLAGQGPNSTKENNNPDADGYISNPYLSIAMARDSLRQREEAKKKQAELTELENEANELKQMNEEERVAIQGLEALLIKRRRRVEKCRRLAEAQSNYKAVLEKMIRDAMHQSVVYKEQLRLNQAATSTLMARLEAQRAMCDSSETELRKKYQHRDDLERQIKPERKRYRVDDGLLEERLSESVKYLSARRLRSSPLKQELRVFLEEDQRYSDAYISLGEEEIGEGTSTRTQAFSNARNEPSKVINFPRRSLSIEQNTVDTERGRTLVREKLEELAIKERQHSRRRETKETMRSRGTGTPLRSRNDKAKATLQKCYESETEKYHVSETVSIPRTSSLPSPPYRAIGMYGTSRYGTDQSMLLQKSEALHHLGFSRPEDDENMNHVGKGNVDKWLHMLMDNQQEDHAVYHSSDEHDNDEENASDEQQMQSRIDEESCRNGVTECSDEIVEVEDEIVSDQGAERGRNSFGIKEREEKKIWFPRSDSTRGFRSLPSSPSKILGMRRGVECMGRKPKVAGDDDCRYGYEDSVSTSSSKFLSRCKQAIKKAVHK
ncbi:hypothetical protein BDA96_03G050300 [Sorghum bicolor]|uniref:Uncharacterized protein n=2 Tax=Sorghum bicolor TaxID=4558 RepID=A0A921RA52_SORBI|nr:uncharacterized protein LOC8078792 [Sorghum bicolor]EES00205.1 hypothetical protein SORBI_3003G047200 [Sorghum bicolor]KAG0536285.1 hypothetical protein BDA96_03G050300 [Sorghum bicolor]|eukprot:XP_002455085.1 uncharacterized protein LOC8078792 [Sorghum bicolor]